jgi:hypothetical protein
MSTATAPSPMPVHVTASNTLTANAATSTVVSRQLSAVESNCLQWLNDVLLAGETVLAYQCQVLSSTASQDDYALPGFSSFFQQRQRTVHPFDLLIHNFICIS